MVMKITDQGLQLGWFPGWGRTVPFDEIAGVELRENGRGPRLVITAAGRGELPVGGLSSELAQALAAELHEILDPALASPGRRLAPGEIEQTIAQLEAKPGFRPSVLLKFLLDQAHRHRATDLHLEHRDHRYLARFRVDGSLMDAAPIPESIQGRLIAHLKGRAGLASYRRDVPQEGRLSYLDSDGAPAEIRLSVVPARGEEALVLRLFDRLRGSLDPDSLGFSGAVRDGFLELLARPRGLVLVAGPSSTGKTTTIYAALQRLMAGPRSGQRAVSLEDPIEYPLAEVSQIEVVPERGLTFDRLLATVLRQDAEVIVVGEVRDEATAAIALRAALTGHLILSTVHSAGAAQSTQRMLNLGVDPAGLAEALTGVLAQRLVRQVCPRCRRERDLTDAERRDQNIPAGIVRVAEGAGCEHCLGAGYFGRTAVAELLTVSPEIAALIAAGARAEDIREAAGRRGFVDLVADAWAKVAGGTTTIAEARRIL